MTLVVAAIHDDDRLTMVSDTKITWVGDPERTRRTYEEALAKIVLLRKDLAVGIAGDHPHERIRLLASLRDAPVEEIRDALWREDRAAFIVAALNPAQLWVIEDGEVRPCLRGPEGWIGDEDAHDLFQKRYVDWPSGTETPFRLMSSMQWLTTPFGPVPSVGGYTLQASGAPDTGFRFALRYDAVVTQTVSELFVFAGHGGTPGAIGLLHPHLRSGRLFRHEAPDASVPVVASTPDEFVRIAMEEHDQEVIHGGRPPGLDFLN